MLLLQVLTACLSHQDTAVRIAAMRATTSFILVRTSPPPCSTAGRECG